MNCVSPASSACVAGAPPLNGMCTASVPVSTLNSSPARCPALPLLPEPNDSLPGLAFAYAMNSFTLFTGDAALTTSTFGRDRDQRDRREVLRRVVGHRLVEARIDRMRGQRAHQDRVAVGRRLRDHVGADVAAGAGLVLHNHRLAPHLGELLRDEAAGDVERSAGRERHDQLHGLRRDRPDPAPCLPAAMHRRRARRPAWPRQAATRFVTRCNRLDTAELRYWGWFEEDSSKGGVVDARSSGRRRSGGLRALRA